VIFGQVPWAGNKLAAYPRVLLSDGHSERGSTRA